MSDKPNFEIPESMRAIAERNVEQARDAYERFMGMAKQAQTLASGPATGVAGSAAKLQTKAMTFAEENMESSFDFASKLTHAKDLTEALMLQQEFAQEQMKAYVSQTQEMTKALNKLADRAKSGAKTSK